MNRAGPTLLQTTTKLRARQTDRISNHPKQRRVRAHIDVIFPAIHCQGNHNHPPLKRLYRTDAGLPTQSYVWGCNWEDLRGGWLLDVRCQMSAVRCVMDL